MPNNTADRISIIEQTRKFVADTLLETFTSVTGHPSERQLAQKWLQTLRVNPSILPEGWYQPPPSGIIMLFGKPNDFQRLDFASLRSPEYWPAELYHLSKDTLIYAYYSPVDRTTGLIGDLAITLYQGTNVAIRQHLALALDLTASMVQYAEVGMPLRELYRYGADLMQKAGVINKTVSVTDPHGVDIGHTIPWSSGSQSAEEEAIIRSTRMKDIADLLRAKRSFVDASTELVIQPDFTFTIEPKIATNKLPTVSFHVIVTFSAGRKRTLSQYRSLFAHFGMPQYLSKSSLSVLELGPDD